MRRGRLRAEKLKKKQKKKQINRVLIIKISRK